MVAGNKLNLLCFLFVLPTSAAVCVFNDQAEASRAQPTQNAVSAKGQDPSDAVCGITFRPSATQRVFLSTLLMHDPLHSSHCCLILLRTNTVTSQTLHCVLSQFAVLGRIQSTEGDIIFALWVQVGVSVFPCCDESVFLPDLALCVGSAF